MPGVWISVSCFGSTPLKLSVGLGVQASKETAKTLRFSKLYPLGDVFDGFFYCNLLCLVRDKAELNYFSSLALNIFKGFTQY